ncbi:SLATT domain-containing protein [Undibacterium sp. RuTC16W]|uniref:SLATT domain-containing protein n=1 Tax=Undibacterium sp. RuTC16W TaxID=3413048 RepID=UPI003BF35307
MDNSANKLTAIDINKSAESRIEDAKRQLMAELNASIDWYKKESESRGWRARWLRVAMIGCGGLATITPSFSQMAISDRWTISPLWTSVFIALTASLYAYEKLYGHAEAWMRFVLAQQELERLREEFSLHWLQLSLNQFTTPDATICITELLRVSAHRHDIVKKETEKWTKAFKDGLKSTTPKTSSSPITD